MKLADKRYPCFIYDPFEESVFNEDDEELNQDKVVELIKRLDGQVPGEDDIALYVIHK